MNFKGRILNQNDYDLSTINKNIINLLNNEIVLSKSKERIKNCKKLLNINYSEKLDGLINYSKDSKFTLNMQEYNWLLSNPKDTWVDYIIYR